ncbi:nuA3 HAT complex component NTO1-like [Pyrus ussuriensis x Pyrus communis]|uniref:NuA3 HAT complex component NTO1-like n=1 Tax=Pyrus ussuriensis x Pyrus communis TaxID=2448454 RepID=A0A5N5FV28_9ROSA|nr:nuA3 HAT complex component NTO1-like [Pyrus ussuriensis x Pyrus communis]
MMGGFCAICQSTDRDPLDPIVFCDGCDLMVHASCYGNLLVKGILESNWFYAKCTSSTAHSQSIESCSCCLCPVNCGVMKPTGDGR